VVLAVYIDSEGTCLLFQAICLLTDAILAKASPAHPSRFWRGWTRTQAIDYESIIGALKLGLRSAKSLAHMAAKHRLNGYMTGMLGLYLAAAELVRCGFIVSPTSRSAIGADLLGTRWFVFLLVAVTCVGYLGLAADASAQSRCLVADPTGTPLNVRTSPDGAILGTLPNDLPVTVLDTTSYRGKAWAHIGRTANNSPIGWVFHDYLDCGRNSTGQFRLLSSQAFRYSGEETFTVSNSEQCESHCASDQSCVAFTFFHSSRQCRPMRSISNLIDNQDAESGIKLSRQEGTQPSSHPSPPSPQPPPSPPSPPATDTPEACKKFPLLCN
jgi:Bacterial SH3 domain/PAN domain